MTLSGSGELSRSSITSVIVSACFTVRTFSAIISALLSTLE